MNKKTIIVLAIVIITFLCAFFYNTKLHLYYSIMRQLGLRPKAQVFYNKNTNEITIDKLDPGETVNLHIGGHYD